MSIHLHTDKSSITEPITSAKINPICREFRAKNRDSLSSSKKTGSSIFYRAFASIVRKAIQIYDWFKWLFGCYKPYSTKLQADPKKLAEEYVKNPDLINNEFLIEFVEDLEEFRKFILKNISLEFAFVEHCYKLGVSPKFPNYRIKKIQAILSKKDPYGDKSEHYKKAVKLHIDFANLMHVYKYRFDERQRQN